MTTGQAGYPTTLTLNFYNMTSGSLVDPTGVIQLDVTYGQEIGFASDVAGPFYYSGASTPSSTQIYRISTGVYAFVWQIPSSAQQGVYIANWSVGYGGNTFLVTEDFPVTGGFAPAKNATDTGFWTGSITYNAPYGTVSIPIGSVDGNGTAWILKKVEGMDSSPAVGNVAQRSGDHGGWQLQQFYGPRVITMTLLASAPTQALRDVARAQLQQAVPVGDLATFTINEPVPKQLSVRRNGSAVVTETYPTLADVEFVIPMVAPDPRKYSTQTNSVSINATSNSTIGVTLPAALPWAFPAQPPAGSGVITNSGTFETRPVITINGPITGPGLTNTTYGQSVTWSSLTLGANDILTVDFNARQGFLNGAFRAADSLSSWWTLYPGANSVQLTGTTTGGGAMTVSWSSAWI